MSEQQQSAAMPLFEPSAGEIRRKSRRSDAGGARSGSKAGGRSPEDVPGVHVRLPAAVSTVRNGRLVSEATRSARSSHERSIRDQLTDRHGHLPVYRHRGLDAAAYRIGPSTKKFSLLTRGFSAKRSQLTAASKSAPKAMRSSPLFRQRSRPFAPPWGPNEISSTTLGPTRARCGFGWGFTLARDGSAGKQRGSRRPPGGRIASAGHGGQVLLSDATRGLVAHELPEGSVCGDLAEHRLKDLPRPSGSADRGRWARVAFSRLLSLDARPNNLPPPTTPRSPTQARAR